MSNETEVVKFVLPAKLLAVLRLATDATDTESSVTVKIGKRTATTIKLIVDGTCPLNLTCECPAKAKMPALGKEIAILPSGEVDPQQLIEGVAEYMARSSSSRATPLIRRVEC